MPRAKPKKKRGSSLVERKKQQREGKQKKEKCTVMGEQKYTIEQILEKAEDCIDRFDYDMAQKFCQRALEMAPDHIQAVETVGTLLLEVGNTDGAKQCFGRAVELQPDVGHAKYMYLGQLFEGAEAVQCFQKGIELMVKEKGEKQNLEVAAACRDPDNDCVTDRDISNAYCSLAEIYMTDSCFEGDAENKCSEHVDKAIASDVNNPEAYQLKASYLLSKDDQEEAKEMIKKSVLLWLPQLQALDKGEVTDDIDPIEPVSLTYETRIAAAKILIEVEEYAMACDVLESLLDEDDEAPVVWYMLGWANYLLGSDYKGNSRYYLDKASQVYKKVKCTDEELLKHIMELLQELGPGDAEDDGDDVDDNSDEIVSSDEENGDNCNTNAESMEL